MDGGKGTPAASGPRSRLADYADLAGPARRSASDETAGSEPDRSVPDRLDESGVEPLGEGPADAAQKAVGAVGALSRAAPPLVSHPLPALGQAPLAGTSTMSAPDEARLMAGRREFAALLGEFRRTAVLVPLAGGVGDDDGERVLTAELNGIRWIYAFSDEAALARFALARGEGGREWPYRRVLGARLLDVAVPLAGVPCGVVLDAADGAEGGVLFPPVRGIVPDAVAVDVDGVGGLDVGGAR